MLCQENTRNSSGDEISKGDYGDLMIQAAIIIMPDSPV